MKTSRKSVAEQGFTIVELMIALSIFSVILIVSTVVLIQIGALYSKGVNSADLQNATRTVVADISGQLQFSGRAPQGCTDIVKTCYANTRNNFDAANTPVYSYCIGRTRYSYVLNRALGTDPSYNPAQATQHVLWRDTLTDDSCPVLDIINSNNLSAAPSKGDGYEMLGAHMSLTKFWVKQVSGSSGIYRAEVWTAFGDNDLLNKDLSTGKANCIGSVGSQFCATSQISTQLTGRIY